jgi:hypothetical protein
VFLNLGDAECIGFSSEGAVGSITFEDSYIKNCRSIFRGPVVWNIGSRTSVDVCSVTVFARRIQQACTMVAALTACGMAREGPVQRAEMAAERAPRRPDRRPADACSTMGQSFADRQTLADTGAGSYCFSACSFGVTGSATGAGINANVGSSSVAVEGCAFLGCTAAGAGGGICLSTSGTTVVQHSCFSGCVAGTNGGGVSFDSYGALTVTELSLSSCSSGSEGGGIYFAAAGRGTLLNYTLCTTGAVGGAAASWHDAATDTGKWLVSECGSVGRLGR